MSLDPSSTATGVPYACEWPVERSPGPFETFCNSMYDDGFAGQKDRRDQRIITPEEMASVTVTCSYGPPPQEFLETMRKETTEYLHYEYLQMAGIALDQGGYEDAAMDLFVSSLGWIMYLGRERDATFNLLRCVSPVSTDGTVGEKLTLDFPMRRYKPESTKQSSLTELMESKGLDKVNVAAFVETLASGDSYDFATRKMAAFPSVAKL